VVQCFEIAGRSLLDYELRIRETATAPIHPVRLVAQIQKVVATTRSLLRTEAIRIISALLLQPDRRRVSSRRRGTLRLSGHGNSFRHGGQTRAAGQKSCRAQRDVRSVSTRWNSTQWCVITFLWWWSSIMTARGDDQAQSGTFDRERPASVR